MKLFAILWLTLLCALPVCAQSITFEWDLSESDSLLGPAGGYKLFGSKQSMTYAPPEVTNTAPGVSTVTIGAPGLGRWFFVLTAFDSEGNESDYSNEVTIVIKPKPPHIKSAVLTAGRILAKPLDALAGLFSKDKPFRIKRIDYPPRIAE